MSELDSATGKELEGSQNNGAGGDGSYEGGSQHGNSDYRDYDSRDSHFDQEGGHEFDDGQRRQHRGHRGGSVSYRRGGRGQYRRGRGNRGNYHHNQRYQQDGYEGGYDEASGDVGSVGQQWNGPENERGRPPKRYSSSRGGRGRVRTKSEKSSLLDGKREPLPESGHQSSIDDLEEIWDVVVSGYSADMTEDDLWDTFGKKDVAGIMPYFTHDKRPYCHIYTTSEEMTKELLRCNRDTFRGNTLFVSMAEEIIIRGVSQMLKKKPQKPKFRKTKPDSVSGDGEQSEQAAEPEASEQEELQPDKAEDKPEEPEAKDQDEEC